MTDNIKAIAGDRFILWGANWSLYTAKVRPYLIKKGIEYVELNPSHPHFIENVCPRSVISPSLFWKRRTAM